VFVLSENFYEPVEANIGSTKGSPIEITQGLSVGEDLVTQGASIVYAKSLRNR
jgi:cation efflux system membrane fusion protein